MQLLTWTGAHYNASRGVLMPDPMRPCICFELASKATVKKSQVKMPADKQIFQKQADDRFKFCKPRRLDDDKSTELLLTKTQTCAWTLESLCSRRATQSESRRACFRIPEWLEWRRGLGTLGLPLLALMTKPAATRQVGAQMQIGMRAMRAAAWRTMEPMAATLRRSFFRSLGRC